MKKIILSLLLCVAGLGMANAQYDYSSASRLDSIENAMSQTNARLAEMRADSVHNAVWRHNGYTNIGYTIASTANEKYEAQNAKFGVFLNVGKSYVWPRKSAFGGVVKVGLDVRFIDLQFAMYDKFARAIEPMNDAYNSYQGWISNMTPSTGDGTSTDLPNYATFNHMQLTAGLIGIGPTVTVAPLTFLNNAASSLRLNLYFHYQPTCGINFYNAKTVYAANGVKPVDGIERGESESFAEIGYVNMLDWGFKLQWRTFGLGFECRWGSGKMSNSTFEPYYNGKYFKDININGADDPEGNYTRKYGESRIYINFAF